MGILVKPVNPVLQTGHPYAPGLSAYWALTDRGGTTARDAAGSSRHLILTNTTWGTGSYGPALSFAGGSSGPSVSNAGNAITDFGVSRTVLVRCRPDTTGTQRGIISTGDAAIDGGSTWILIQRPGNVWAVYHGGQYNEGVSTIAAGTWYTVVYTFDAATNALKLYVNGVLENATTVADATTSRGNIWLGVGYNAAFSGLIDVAAVWKVLVMTAGEVAVVTADPTAVLRSRISPPISARSATASIVPRAMSSYRRRRAG